MLFLLLSACAIQTVEGDLDGDGFRTFEGDCDDANAAVGPHTEEVCGDAVDNDCDGDIDEGEGALGAVPYWEDHDDDGYGDGEAASIEACAAPDGYVDAPGDCDDTDATIAPGTPEICDGADQDCDDAVDEDATDATRVYTDADGDGFGDGATGTDTCDAGAGVADGTDCDDGDASVNPGATELCDGGTDEDCDGETDEADAADARTWYTDADADGYGEIDVVACTQPSDTVEAGGDCDDTDQTISPAASEVCDGSTDEDCDGAVDEDEAVDAPIWYDDADGDGYGADASGRTACAAPTGAVAAPGDCDDTSALASPVGTETCDGTDEDCDADVDEGFDADADGLADCFDVEECDAVDNDGDGDIDEAPAVCPESCLAHQALGETTSGTYLIDPGGAGAFEVWCEMSEEGGGWTMVLDRTHVDECCTTPCGSEVGVDTTLVDTAVTPSTSNTGMSVVHFDALLAVSTEALALGEETVATCQDTPVSVLTTIAALQSGNCSALGTDLSVTPLAWSEPDCSDNGSDYSLWLGSDGTLTWMTGICDYDAAWGTSVTCVHPGTVRMYVR